MVPMLYGNGEIDPQKSADLILDTILKGIQGGGAGASRADDQLTRIEKAARRIETAVSRLTRED